MNEERTPLPKAADEFEHTTFDGIEVYVREEADFSQEPDGTWTDHSQYFARCKFTGAEVEIVREERDELRWIRNGREK